MDRALRGNCSPPARRRIASWRPPSPPCRAYALTLVPGFEVVIEHAARALRPGGRFVVVDFKAPEGWPPWLLRAIMPLLRPFAVTLGLAERKPWEALARHLVLRSMEERYLGTSYVAIGAHPPAPAS